MAANPVPDEFWRAVWDGAEHDEDKLCVHNYAFDRRLPATFLGELGDLAKSRDNSTGKELFAAFQSFALSRHELVRRDPEATFCGAGSNGPNIPADSKDLPDSVVTVLNLTSLIARAIDVGNRGSSDPAAVEKMNRLLEFFDLSTTSLPAMVNGRLLEPGFDLNNSETRAAVISLYNTLARYSPRHPVWVGARTDFEALTKLSDPATWLEAVGLPPPRRESLLIVLGYSRSHLPAFVRPSQQEAGWFVWHFPSPPCHRPARGGITMRLGSLSRDSRPGARLSPDKRIVREFIHPQIPFALGGQPVPPTAIPIEWIAHGWVNPGHAGSVSDTRTSHHLRLQAIYKGKIVEWMPHPLELTFDPRP
jgi:hypothetical protein